MSVLLPWTLAVLVCVAVLGVAVAGCIVDLVAGHG